MDIVFTPLFESCFPNTQGVKLTFFSDSHLAPKFFKVVANSKKVGHHFQREKIFNVLQSGH